MSYIYHLEYATRTKVIQPQSVGKIVVAREQDEAFFREKMNGSVVVVGEDYDFLRDAEFFALECCQEITFLIERTCGTTKELFWEGYFTLYDIEWDLDNRTATIKKVNVRDRYNVIFSNWHKEVNWFGYIPPHRPAATYPSVHPLVRFNNTTLGSPEYNPSGSTTWTRGFYFNYAILFLVKETLKETGAEAYSDITEAQMSQFLTAETNPVNGKSNFLKDVILMHISDAKRPGSTEWADTGIVTLKEVLADLKSLYNAYWFVDDDGHFRIEHLSFFSNFSYTPPGITLDLTEVRFKDAMKGTNQYSYQTELLKGREGVEQTISAAGYEAKSEVWTQFANPSSPEFSGAYMVYGESCVPRDDKGEASTEFKIINLFTTDWRTVTFKPDTVPDQGWVLVHVTNFLAEDGVNYGWCPVSGDRYINGDLSMTRLYFEFGRTDLSFNYGMFSWQKEQPKLVDPESNYITERPLKARTVKRVKTFKAIELDMCCGDDYDFSGFIKHPLDDNCVVEQLEYDTEQQIVTMTVKSANECTDIPFPDYEEILEPNPDCPLEGQLLRTEQTRRYSAHTAINYVYITEFTDYYADGECGEYTKTRETRTVSPKRTNGPR
ncbi:hypothetical protein DYBT9275_02778 [Dyadobacter sp. CECT 9275]|uniref:Uncharacterized protein n=1 Tax=Dyadobacter helix TaxID=2822344 RepID=A0A916N4R3_9BACT|nr:hypothetical protein [Dyadobacter sp. CECT 9275]CAG5001973.1 hypothetical protein DYBT9275_02778 [Dyadobacter sp. CECT 9275]